MMGWSIFVVKMATCAVSKPHRARNFIANAPNGGRHRASPVWADGKIYLTSRNGKITVVRAGRQFEILAQNDLGEEITASPAIADGTIYLRTFASLIAIRKGR